MTGVAALGLLSVVLFSWKDLYCYLYPDPRLIGKWEVNEFLIVDFGRTGDIVATTHGKRVRGAYRVDDSGLTAEWEDGDVWGSRGVGLSGLYHPPGRVANDG